MNAIEVSADHRVALPRKMKPFMHPRRYKSARGHILDADAEPRGDAFRRYRVHSKRRGFVRQGCAVPLSTLSRVGRGLRPAMATPPPLSAR